MGNEMGNSNVSGVQEQDNNELHAPSRPSEASMPSNVADGVEVKLPDLTPEAEGLHEKLDESAFVNQPEMGDQQIQGQTSTERENENDNLQSPNESFEDFMPPNGNDGDDKNSSTLTPEEQAFPEKPAEPSEIGAIDEKLSALPSEAEDFPERPAKPTEIGAFDEKFFALPSEAEDFHEKPVKPFENGDLQIENQTSTEEEETKTSKQTTTDYKPISTESVNQKHNEQESIDSSARSCMENSNHDNIIGSDGSCDSNQKGDTIEILEIQSDYIGPHSDLDIEKNVKDMLMEETEKQESQLLDKICMSGECDENQVELERGYGLSRESIVQSGGLENGDEQQSKLNSDKNESIKLPSIISFDSYQEANDSEIKRVCQEDHAEVIENGYEVKYNDNQGPILITEDCRDYINESKTNENGKRTDHGDKKTDSNDGFCGSGIGSVEVDKENEIESKFEIESKNSSPSLDLGEHSKHLEKVQERINVATSLTEHKDTDTTLEEITEVGDDESFKQPKLLESGKAEEMAIQNHPSSSSDSIQKYVDVIEWTTRKTKDSQSFNESVGKRTEQLDSESDNELKEHELYATSNTEEQKGSVEEVVQPILKQSDPSQRDTITEVEMEEQIIPQSDRTEQEMIVEGEQEEPILDQSDPILQETNLVKAYLVSVDHSQKPEKALILLESKRSIADSDEENFTKVDEAKNFDANSSNPMVDTSALPPESEDPTSQVSKVEILSCRSGELFVLPMHKTNEQEQKCGLMSFEGVHDSNMDFEMPENSDTFSFEFENLFAEAQVPTLESQKEVEQNPSLHLHTETVKGVASASERGHFESDTKNLNVPGEVIKTDVSTLEKKIEESEIHPLLQQPNEKFHSELEDPIAEDRISVLNTSKEEPIETTMPLLKTSAGSEVLSTEISDSRKIRTPIQRILKEETCLLESLQKQENTLLKGTVDEAWKSPNKVTSTSPGQRKKHKPRYSLFGNCMCCTTVQ